MSIYKEVVPVSRVQLALNVSDLDESVAFYTRLLGTGPAKVRPGYANFAVADPPLKLVLIEGGGEAGTINHLGVEVGSTAEVGEAASRLADAGLATDVEEQTTCCYAVQDKVWVTAPDRTRWEVYTVLAHAEGDGARGGDERCCTTGAPDVTKAPAPSSCC
jgi:catechol 2,3-dioxygenase-like lactoylglutathione lyase family enzyme